MITLKEAIKDTLSTFDHACTGVLYYIDHVNGQQYQFPIDMNDKDDVGTTTFVASYKPITLMRYIRKAIANETLLIVDKSKLR